MKRVFYIVGPTATGKSEIAAEIASQLNAEIVNADAFQIYRGLDRLTAKPDKATLAKAPHHLLGAVLLSEEMHVEKFRAAAVEAIREIHARGKPVIVAGGSGLYVKALTHGLSRLPAADPNLRAQLSELSLDELCGKLIELDPEIAGQADMKNRRRVSRALEICMLSGKPFSAQRTKWKRELHGSTGILPAAPNRQDACATVATFTAPEGIFVFRERAELYERIDRRVEKMFSEGVVEEVRALREIGSTAEKALGLREIRAFLAGEISEAECIAKIQQATRRYAKRQLTWFQRQDNFEPLNLSSHGFPEAIELIMAQTPKAFGVAQTDD